MNESALEIMVATTQGNPGAANVLGQIAAKSEALALSICESLKARSWPGWVCWVAYKNYAKGDLDMTAKILIDPPPGFIRVLNQNGLKNG